MPGGSGRDEAGLPSVEAGDTLRLQVWSNVACTFRAVVRIRPVSGKTSAYPFEVTAGSARATASQIYKIERGGIIDSVMIEATPKGTETAPTQRGQSYAKLDLTNGGCLSCGYVYPGHQPALNEFVEPGPAGGPGALVRVTLSATITAGRILGVVPTGALWRWLYDRIDYSASATVGARAVLVEFRDASANIFAVGPVAAPAASGKASFSIAPNTTTEQTVIVVFPGSTATVGSEFPSPDRALPAGYDLFVADGAAIDGLDTVLCEAQVEEWVVPN